MRWNSMLTTGPGEYYINRPGFTDKNFQPGRDIPENSGINICPHYDLICEAGRFLNTDRERINGIHEFCGTDATFIDTFCGASFPCGERRGMNVVAKRTCADIFERLAIARNELPQIATIVNDFFFENLERLMTIVNIMIEGNPIDHLQKQKEEWMETKTRTLIAIADSIHLYGYEKTSEMLNALIEKMGNEIFNLDDPQGMYQRMKKRREGQNGSQVDELRFVYHLTRSKIFRQKGDCPLAPHPYFEGTVS